MTIRIGKRTLRGDRILRRDGQLILFSGKKQFIVTTALWPVIEIGGMPTPVLPESAMIAETRIDRIVNTDAPQEAGGMAMLKRMRRDRGYGDPRNRELEAMSRMPAGIQESDG